MTLKNEMLASIIDELASQARERLAAAMDLDISVQRQEDIALTLLEDHANQLRDGARRADLSAYLVIGDDGTILNFHSCAVVHADHLGTDEELDELSDAQIGRRAAEYGAPLLAILGAEASRFSDSLALNYLAAILDDHEWDADLMDRVADVIRGTGRPIKDI